MINPKISNSFKKLSKEYNNKEHYPHIVFDDFLDPTLANVAANELLWYSEDLKNTPGDDHDDQVKKRSVTNLNQMPGSVALACTYFNGDVFVNYLRELTGIKDLVSDWTYEGGGCHFTYKGGRLGVHHDFNYTDSLGPKRLYRKVNLLVYLNKEWESDWGGSLELWKPDLSESFKTIDVKFNRAVLFNIENAPHGHPHPLNCPEEECRRSLAFYYYSEEEPEGKLYNRAYWLRDGKLK